MERKGDKRGRLGRPSRSTLQWRTKEGKVVQITDMEDNHLINALRLMKREMLKQLAKFPPDEKLFPEADWRKMLTPQARERVYFMETECIKRGICWNPEGDIGGAGKLSEEKLNARSEACAECEMGLVCLDKKFVVRRCSKCKRCFVPMGGVLRDVYVHPECPRRVERRGGRFQRWCQECA